MTNFKTLLLLDALLFPVLDWTFPASSERRLQDSAVLGAAASADDNDDSGQEQFAAAAPAPLAAAGAYDEASLDKLMELRVTCKHCPFVLCIVGTRLIPLCIAFIQIGYEWPVRQEGPCFEQGCCSFDL